MIAHDYLIIQDEMRQGQSLVAIGKLLIKDKSKLGKMIDYPGLAKQITALAQDLFVNFPGCDHKYYCEKELNHLLNEFAKMLNQESPSSESVDEVFRRYDFDKDGKINHQELTSLVNDLLMLIDMIMRAEMSDTEVLMHNAS